MGGQQSMAMAIALEAQGLWKLLGDKSGEANAMLIVAQVYVSEQQFKEATRSLQGAHNIFQSSGDQKGEAACYELSLEIQDQPEGVVQMQQNQEDMEFGNNYGHGWSRVAPNKKPIGFGHQYVRFWRMRGRP